MSRPRTFNREAVLACRKVGVGLFIRALKRELARRGLSVPVFEHDLVAEMRGELQHALTDLPSRAQ